MRSPTVSAALAAFVDRTRWDDLPEAVRHAARRSLLNGLGCALGVVGSPAVAQAWAVHGAVGGVPQATLVGRRERADMPAASFVNAVAINLLDYDDTHLPTVIHPTAPVLPPALAFAEAHGLSGQALLGAFALGAEVACRIGNGVSPGHYARGWHITSTCGVFGAAAASALLLGLDADRTAHALGIAASQSAGLVENLPSAAKNVSVGSAARNGLMAALLAQAGYEAAPTAIEGPLGWARAMGDTPDVAAMLDGLGERWEVSRNTFKPYPSGIVFHAVTDACLALRSLHDLDPDGIAEIVVQGDQLLLDRGDRAVNTPRDARVSIHHTAAGAFLFGSATVADYESGRVFDPAMQAFRARVRAELAPELPRGAAHVQVRMVDGRHLAHTVLHPRGSEEHPLTDVEIEAKVRDCVADGAPGCDAGAVIGAVWDLDAQPDTRRLMAALTPA